MTSMHTAHPVPEPRIDAQSGNSPETASIPFWLTACIRLAPPRRANGSAMDTAADKVLVAAQVLIAHCYAGHGKAKVELDRELVARFCGYSSAKKCSWIFDYLQKIGFLAIERHHAKPGRDGNRRGRAADTFITYDKPPLNYIGPRNFAELAQSLRDPSPLASILFVDDSDIETPSSDRKHPNGDLRCRPRNPNGTADDVSAVQTVSTQMGTFGVDQGTQMGPTPDVSAVQTVSTQMGTFSRARRSDQILSEDLERRGSESEPVPGRTAEPPATGNDERQQAIAELVARLPWREWAKKHQRDGLVLTVADVDQVQAAISQAMTDAGITLDEASEVALAAMRAAKKCPVRYVVSAFSARNLRKWQRQTSAAELSNEPLPLGDAATDTAADQDNDPAPTATASSGPDRPYRPYCPKCETPEGEGPISRLRLGEDGGMQHCECRAASFEI